MAMCASESGAAEEDTSTISSLCVCVIENEGSEKASGVVSEKVGMDTKGRIGGRP